MDLLFVMLLMAFVMVMGLVVMKNDDVKHPVEQVYFYPSEGP